MTPIFLHNKYALICYNIYQMSRNKEISNDDTTGKLAVYRETPQGPRHGSGADLQWIAVSNQSDSVSAADQLLDGQLIETSEVKPWDFDLLDALANWKNTRLEDDPYKQDFDAVCEAYYDLLERTPLDHRPDFNPLFARVIFWRGSAGLIEINSRARGGMGKIHKCFFPQLGVIAAKVVDLQTELTKARYKGKSRASIVQAYRRNRRALVNEAQVMGHDSTQHAHVTNVYDWLMTDIEGNRATLMFMEWKQGATFAQLLEDVETDFFDVNDEYHRLALSDRDLPSWRRVVKWIGQIADATEYMSMNVLTNAGAKEQSYHQDLSAKNIIVDQNDDAWIYDFGIAQSTIVKDTGQVPVSEDDDWHIYGTTRFMPPERSFDDYIPSSRSETWSIAVNTYLLLTGEYPFDAPKLSGERLHEAIVTIILTEGFNHIWQQPTYQELLDMIENQGGNASLFDQTMRQAFSSDIDQRPTPEAFAENIEFALLK